MEWWNLAHQSDYISAKQKGEGVENSMFELELPDTVRRSLFCKGWVSYNAPRAWGWAGLWHAWNPAGSGGGRRGFRSAYVPSFHWRPKRPSSLSVLLAGGGGLCLSMR